MEKNQQTILYVEDDADDREFLAEAIKEVNPAVDILFATNGAEALAMLHGINGTQARLPSLIVLDINMPYLDGRETFKRLKNNAVLQSIPVVVFTSGSNPNDKALFNNLGIEYITKPDNFTFMNGIASRMLSMCVG